MPEVRDRDDPLYSCPVESDLKAAPALLREARRRAGLTQVELAARAGVAQSVISAYERGRREPGLATLLRLVEASGCQLALELRSPPGTGRELPATPVGERIRRCRTELLDAARRHGVTDLYVFGSVVRGDDGPDSDIDVAALLPPTVGLVEMGVLEGELAAILGQPVDLVPVDQLRPSVRRGFDDEAVAL